jgi:hypothetical protein
MALPAVGRVVKQISPERFTFIKSAGHTLIPGNYVEVVPKKTDHRIPAIIEEFTGKELSPSSGVQRYAQYEYHCKILSSGVAYELVGATVFIPDPGASLAKLFSTQSKVSLNVGELSGIDGHVSVVLNGENLLGTHSCMLGSSGSGKTTLLGLLLEEILLNCPDTQIVILDLNSDFATFDQARLETDVNSKDNACENITDEVLRQQQKALKSISMDLIPLPQIKMQRFSSPDLLQLESIPYHFKVESLFDHFCKNLPKDKPISPATCEEKTRDAIQRNEGIPAGYRYLLQDEELKGLTILRDFFKRMKDAPIWSSEETDSLDLLEKSDPSRLIEYNLGRLQFSHRAILAEGVLRKLWERNEKTKNPTFVIIDEAHNLAPAIPEEPWQKRTLEWVNRISGEGRKYGLHLILVSQRPAKIHPNALDNCRNFFVLKLQNQDDLLSLSKSTLDVSAELISRAATFRRHEALIYGDLGPPAIIRTGRRRMN